MSNIEKLQIVNTNIYINLDTEIIENSDDYLKLIILKSDDYLNLSELGIININFKLHEGLMDKVTKINLKSNMLKHIYYIPTNISGLNLSHNQIKNIDILSNQINLTYLNLSYNSDLIINLNTFDNLVNLNKLNLAGINLNSIHPTLFKNLLNLIYLNLAGNDIESIEGVYFPPNLNTLNLTYNKLLTYKSEIASLTKLINFYI
jgi:Leucine-rich repeat (LRR) protein